MKFLGRFAALLFAAVMAGAPIHTTSRYDVTVDVGICENESRDGHVIAAYGYEYDPEYSYISYRSTDARPGDVILTICYLTKGSEDDIVQRVDYLLRHARP